MFKNKESSNGHDFKNSGRKSDAFPSGDELEGRTQEPKVRWNPRPEQIRILKNIFNSGMVNPPREEIAKIRAQLQVYGPVEDTNVYCWFQNRKSRSKLKNRQQKSTTSRQPLLASSSSSNSCDRSSSNVVQSGRLIEIYKNSTSGSMNQNYSIANTQNDQYLNVQPNQVHLQPQPPYYCQNQQTGAIATGVFGGGQTSHPRFNEIMGGGDAGISSQMESFSRMLLASQMMAHDSSTTVVGGGRRISTFEGELGYMIINPNAATQNINTLPPTSSYQIPSTSQLQGVGAGMVGLPKSTITVCINGVKFEGPGIHPFPVKEAFGEHAVLFHQSGNPIPTNNWGVTLHPLDDGASYFVRHFPPAAAPNQLPFN